MFLQLWTWKTIGPYKDMFMVNQLGGCHSEWGIRLEGQSLCFPNENVKIVYTLVKRLAYANEFDLNFVFF